MMTTTTTTTTTAQLLIQQRPKQLGPSSSLYTHAHTNHTTSRTSLYNETLCVALSHSFSHTRTYILYTRRARALSKRYITLSISLACARVSITFSSAPLSIHRHYPVGVLSFLVPSTLYIYIYPVVSLYNIILAATVRRRARVKLYNIIPPYIPNPKLYYVPRYMLGRPLTTLRR